MDAPGNGLLVILDSISDGNQQNKTRLENLFYHRDIITIAKLKTWAPCEISNSNQSIKLMIVTESIGWSSCSLTLPS